MNELTIKGAGGGGKGGGSSSHTPQETANSLRSQEFASVLDAVCEGEIGGLANGLQSVYLDGVALQNADGTYNFTNVTVASTTGTQTQAYLPGFSDVENPNQVGVEVKQSASITRTITNANVNAVRVTIQIPALTYQDPNSGDISGTSVQIAIDVQTNGGGYVQMIADTVNGKTNSVYQRSYRIQLSGTGPWDIRVRRITADSTQSNLQNKTFFSSYTEIIDAKLAYPNTALVGIKIDASQFSQIPVRSYDLQLLKIKVPSNYDPVARTYSGIWDGTFKIAWSNNPAWCFYDLLTNTRYGLGNYINATQVDKWALYTAGQYCDQTVPDGFGGTEPRFTCNMYIQTRAEAYKVMQDMASVFRAMTYWQTGSLTVSQDAPADPVYLYTPSNVIDGLFTYIGSSAKSRHTVALVTWNDPADSYKQKIEYVEDTAGIARYGVIDTQVVAVGCTSRGQANRVGRWLLYTEQYQSEAVAFKTGIEGAVARPGQVIAVADPARAGTRYGGRIVSATTTQVTLDAAPTGDMTGATLSVIQPSGSVEKQTVSLVSGSVVTVTAAFSSAPVAGSIWVLQTAAVGQQLFRIISAKENDDGTIDINALAHNPNKYAYVENGLVLQPRSISVLSVTPSPPTSVSLSESLYKYQAEVRSKVNVTWPAVSNATSYQIVWTKDNGNANTDVTSSNDYDILNTTPGVYSVKVYSTGASGNTSTTYTTGSITALGKTAPPDDVTGLTSTVDSNIGITLTWNRVADLDVDSYEVRNGSSWATATVVGQVKGTSIKIGVIPPSTQTYLVKALDTTGHYSNNAASTTVGLAAAGAPTLATAFVGPNLVLTWAAVAGSLAVDHYEIRYGSSWASGTLVGSVSATTFSLKAAWSGARTFWIAAVDIAGNYGAAGSATATVNAPGSVSITQQVIDNNVLLQWGDATQTLPIDYYELRKGSTWAGATVIGRINGRFTTIFETSNGTYTYWIQGVDVAGNAGAQSNIAALVSAPPDYQLQYNKNSTFNGTLSNIVSDGNGNYYGPIDPTETWQSHFTSRGWTSPQDQVNAGYSIYAMPATASGYYEETIDYGAVLAATKITASLSSTAVAGSVTLTPTISVKLNSTDAWTDYVSVNPVYVTNFRYAKIRYALSQTGGTNLVDITGLNIRFDVKLKNDAGSINAVSTDVSGTVVTFNVPFVSVTSITLTPSGSTPAIAVYSLAPGANPTTFNVYLYNTSGTRISGTVAWSAKGY